MKEKKEDWKQTYRSFLFVENNNDDEVSQMATDELVRLQTNLNTVNNEVNSNDFIRGILFLIIVRF